MSMLLSPWEVLNNLKPRALLHCLYSIYVFFLFFLVLVHQETSNFLVTRPASVKNDRVQIHKDDFLPFFV
jgi:hypothetical protein